MKHPLLEIKNLQIDFKQDQISIPAVQHISFSIHRGETTAIVGESGSGKTVTSLSILQLLPKQANLKGEILFSPTGNEIFLLNSMPEKEMILIRGNNIAMIFQEPMTSLNPLLSCGFQVMETIIKHQQLSKHAARLKTIELFNLVGLPDPGSMLYRFPHEISGGQKQRVMIAMAMSCQPDILIADEPTTALDVKVQKNILQLLKDLQGKSNMALMFVTHDLDLAKEVADNILVMYNGLIVEQGNAKEILNNPKHPYTKALLACKPNAGNKGKRLKILKDFFEPETKEPIFLNDNKKNDTQNKVILSVKDLNVFFPSGRNFFGKTSSYFRAVNDVSFDVKKGETVGLVGESGCGKSTLGRTILQLIKPTSGKIIFHGNDIAAIQTRNMRETRKDLQIIFQDPYGSLNPRLSIGNAILEALKVHKLYDTDKARKERVIDILEKVQISQDSFNRYPHQFSGGQRQRICIARALVLNPTFLIFDEAVSALDVSVQSGILNLISDLKKDMDFSSIFISHDLSVIHYISDRILVMNNGKIVEEGNANEIFHHPKTIYTQQLIDSIPGNKPNYTNL